MMRFAMVTQHLQLQPFSLAFTAWTLYADKLVEVARSSGGNRYNEILACLNMLRAFNSREGIGRESDTLPKKMFKRPLEGGRSDGYALDEKEWEAALEDYYRLCDWDVKTGHPSLKKMESLGLGWVVAENDVLSQVIS